MPSETKKRPPTLLELAGDQQPISGSATSRTRNRKVPTSRTAGPYQDWAEPPQLAADLNHDAEDVIATRLGISRKQAYEIVKYRQDRPFDRAADLDRVRGIGPSLVRRLRYRAVGRRSTQPAITGLEIAPEHILSGQPYEVHVTFVPAGAPVEVAELTIHWQGGPYRIQRKLNRGQRADGQVRFRLYRDVLPVGPVRFNLRLFDSDGGTADAGIGTYVLPSNPLSVMLTPGNAHYISTDVRAILNAADRSFTTLIDWTVSNTTGTSRTFEVLEWRATDGGSHLETVASDYSSSVPNNATRSFRTTLSSPANSPIGKLLNKGGDFTLRLRLRDDRGVTIQDTIIVQPWLGYNMNIIRVGPLQAGDRAGLAQAANRASGIYQQINLTMNRLENNWRVTGTTSQWETLSTSEFDDLLEYASVPNNGIDVFVVRDYTGGTGRSPRPGDCSKGGDSDGLVIDRRYDGAGNLYWRGMGQTLAHEVGHYFSLETTSSGHTPADAANDFRVMHPTFREDRTLFVWDEYYDAYDHCMLLLLY